MPGGRRHGTGQGPGAHAAATGRPVPVSSAAQPLPVAQNQLTLRPTQDAPGFRTLDAPAQVPAELGETWPLTRNHMSYLLTPRSDPVFCPFPSLAPTPPPWSPSWPHRTSFLTQNVPPRSSDKRRAGVRALHAQVCRPHAAAKDGASPACAPRLTLPARSAQTKAARCPQTGPPAAGTRVAACPGTPAQTSAGRNQEHWVQTVVQDQRAPGPAPAILQGGKLTPRVTRLPAGAHGSPWP